MSESLEFNLFEDETRECPFKYFEAIRHLDKPVYFMPELGAYYVSRYEDVRFIKKHPEIFSNDIYKHGSERGGTSRNIAEEFRNKVSVSQNGQESDQLDLILNHSNYNISNIYLNTLMSEFDSDGITDRRLVYKRTMD